jgi:hypothetical protein
MLARILNPKSARLAAIAAFGFAVGTTAALSTTALSAPARTATWHVVKRKSASGPHPAFTLGAIIRHPRGIGVRLSSPTHVGATIYWDCSNGVTTTKWQIGVLGGFHALPHVRGKYVCHVSVVAHGRDRITVTILKKL